MATKEPGEEGATPRELVLEAARRDNVDLLKGLIDTLWKEPISDSKKSDANVKKAKERVAELINTAFDPIGNHALHLAAKNGNYDVMDLILDQEGVEVDPVDRLDKETPLHKSVRFVNDLPKEEWDAGKVFVKLLIDAGAEPRARNKDKMKPSDIVDGRNTGLKKYLESREYIRFAGSDIIRQDEDDDDDDDLEHNSASDSD